VECFSSSVHVDALAAWIAAHGPLLVAAVVALESMGLPVPGETTLVTAALLAGTTHDLDIVRVVAAAALGAIVGDSAGYWIGRRYGHRLLVRYGPLIRIDSARLRLGQYLFARHGGKVVFFGRFVALLRALAALLAGTNAMPWPRFMAFNAAGGVVWASVFGFGAYSLGEGFTHLEGRLAVAGAVLGVAGVAGGLWFVRRHEAALQRDAERALGPDPHRS